MEVTLTAWQVTAWPDTGCPVPAWPAPAKPYTARQCVPFVECEIGTPSADPATLGVALNYIGTFEVSIVSIVPGVCGMAISIAGMAVLAESAIMVLTPIDS